jgi:hypothetical protein
MSAANDAVAANSAAAARRIRRRAIGNLPEIDEPCYERNYCSSVMYSSTGKLGLLCLIPPRPR